MAIELYPSYPLNHYGCVVQITPPSCVGSAGATPLSQSGFKRSVAGKGQQLTFLAVEVHADCRLVPLHAVVRATFLCSGHVQFYNRAYAVE